jgi:hypothetical protein
MRFALSKLKRPYPPAGLFNVEDPGQAVFIPAPEVRDWLDQCFVVDGGPLQNPDHAHLQSANLQVLWTSLSIDRQMMPVVGQAEIPKPHPALGKWQKARQEFQLLEWYGVIPDFLITLDANYVAECDHLAFCALIEHELYHCALKGYTLKGKPMWAIKGHDVEEHVGVVARYGAGAAAGATSRLVEAAKRKPLIGRAQVEGVCGTKGCLRIAS